MDTLHRGIEVIRRAEDDLRGLLAEAAEAAQYEDLLVLAEWAKQLRALLSVVRIVPPVEVQDGRAAATVAADEGEATMTTVPEAASRFTVPTPSKRDASRYHLPRMKRSARGQRRKGNAKSGAEKGPDRLPQVRARRRQSG